MDAVTQDDMDDFYITFEVIPQTPRFEIVGGTDMVGLDPWMMASDAIVDHAVTRTPPSMFLVANNSMSPEDIYRILLHDLLEDSLFN